MKRMKRIASVFALLLTVALLVPSVEVGAVSGSNHYTYTYDCWDVDRESPDAYATTRTITGADFKDCGNFKNPQGLYCIGNDTYIIDTGNNRIVQLSYNNDKFEYVREIKEFNNAGKKDTFKAPEDCFVTETGEVYVADTGNNRVVHMDKDLNMIKIITRPVDDTVDQGVAFLPSKLVVDSANRIFCNVTNVNKGFMEFDAQGGFTGYVGASEVTFNFIDYVWKLFATKAQKAQMDQFVPTEYSNLCLDSEGFIYATIATLGDADTSIESAKPIRKLNAKGSDILVRNGYTDPYGDIYYTETGELSGSSKMVDVCTLDNDVYYALDNTRGRIFAYDFQGNMLYAFGGHGYRQGYFINPVAIEDLGDTLLVLDEDLGSITQLTLTEYGALINQGLAQYKVGDYDSSADTWKKVLKLNGNYDQAYIGIGRALLRQKDYKEAMTYFKTKMDATNYSKAFKLYRKEWIENNILYILGGLVILILLGYGRGFIKKARKEVKEG